ncbi:hypothetical protein LguiA_016274 [Lonicera macranthoides]
MFWKQSYPKTRTIPLVANTCLSGRSTYIREKLRILPYKLIKCSCYCQKKSLVRLGREEFFVKVIVKGDFWQYKLVVSGIFATSEIARGRICNYNGGSRVSCNLPSVSL